MINERELRRVVRSELVHRRSLAESKRNMLIEARSAVLTDELLQEGIGSALVAGVKTLGSLFGKATAAPAKAASAALNQAIKLAGQAAQAGKETIQAIADSGKAELAAVAQEYRDNLRKALTAKVTSVTKDLMSAVKKEDPKLDDAAAKQIVANIIGDAMAETLASIGGTGPAPTK